MKNIVTYLTNICLTFNVIQNSILSAKTCLNDRNSVLKLTKRLITMLNLNINANISFLGY